MDKISFAIWPVLLDGLFTTLTVSLSALLLGAPLALLLAACGRDVYKRQVLSRAGLVSSQRHSRIIMYRAQIEQLRDMTLFLLKDCCGGSAELCAPLIAELTPCCTPHAGKSA